ncbi:O-antigen ligase family protein [Fluviispira multicolorata]|uniref:O-antigen ligase-related domain-containing protein n=1 Tax=Fluviispira multicolorata TaxID=2654512 RepID=A0A833N0U1_9BACT|nr:O-antigen ligase family protein [Fluviispira multicolorata]KAB8029226.1 hypothetical protein GCL57_11870 [Fluviispira multicolorata]
MQLLKNKMDSINNISHIFFLFNLLIISLFIRIPDIFSQSILRFFLYFLFLVGFIFGVAAVLPKFKVLTFSIFLFISMIILHSFTHFYLPSLRHGIALQNYILQNNITADFEISQTRLYMLFFVLFIIPAMNFFSDLFSQKLKYIYLKVFFYSFIIGAILNSFIALYQGLINLNFLAQGSGTSLAANRAPALLEDSGIASLYFSITFIVFFVAAFDKILSSKLRGFLFLVSLLSLSAGIMNDSRSFYLACALSISIFLITRLYNLIKNKQYKFIFYLSIIISSISGVLLIVLQNFDKTGFKRIINGILEINWNFNLLSMYQQFDYQRTKHLEIMLHSIRDHFPIGTGFGSFATNFYQYKKSGEQVELDLPTNMYFSLISELGIIGVLLLIFSLVILTHFFWKQKNNNDLEIKSYFIKNLLIKWTSISLLFYAFISYLTSNATSAFFTALVFASSLIFLIDNNKKAEKICSNILLASSIFLFSSSLYLINNAPSIPEFRWKERNEPQIPQPVGELPQPEGLKDQKRLYFSQIIKNKISGTEKLYKPTGAQDGIWAAPSTEIVLMKDNLRIYVGSNSEFFRTQVKLKFYNSDKISIIRNIELNAAGWLPIELPHDKSFDTCFDKITYNKFCYLHIEVTPAWRISMFNKVGFFIENNILYFPPLIKIKS